MGEAYGGHGMQVVKLKKPNTNLWPKATKPTEPATPSQMRHLEALLPQFDLTTLNLTGEMADRLMHVAKKYVDRDHRAKNGRAIIRMIRKYHSTADNRGSHSVSHGAGREKTTES